MREHTEHVCLPWFCSLAPGSSSVLLKETWKVSSFTEDKDHNLAFMYVTAGIVHCLWLVSGSLCVNGGDCFVLGGLWVLKVRNSFSRL